MLKKILIGIGSIFIILLLGVWVYLLLFGAPDSTNEMFASLGLGTPTTERPAYVPENTELSVGINDNSSNLIQLTTKPVAGYVVINSTSTNAVRYAEKGTGHIFEINFETNEERKLLGNTVARTVEAHFSPNGDNVVLVSETSNIKTSAVYSVTGLEDTTKTQLPVNINNIELTGSSTVLYTTSVDNLTTAYSLDLDAETTSTLWTTPLSDIKVWWGSGNNTFVINNPAPFLEGALYRVTQGKLTPIGGQHYAYNAFLNEDATKVIETYYNFDSKILESYYLNLTTVEKTNIPIIAIPEKCVFSSKYTNELWCGAPVPNKISSNRSAMNNWYARTAPSEDNLWQTEVDSQSSLIQSNFLSEAGFVIDVTNMSTNPDSNTLFFINKINDALWKYNLNQEETVTEEIDGI